MLDPIKVSIVTPGVADEGRSRQAGHPGDAGDGVSPAPRRRGREDDGLHDPLPLLDRHHQGQVGDAAQRAARLQAGLRQQHVAGRSAPDLTSGHPEVYGGLGLRDLADRMFATLKETRQTHWLAEAFSTLPEAVMTPSAAYQHLVRDEIEHVPLDELADRVLATSVVPYPPGIPMLMPGEATGPDKGPYLGYLRALAEWDKSSPASGMTPTESRTGTGSTTSSACARPGRRQGQPRRRRSRQGDARHVTRCTSRSRGATVVIYARSAQAPRRRGRLSGRTSVASSSMPTSARRRSSGSSAGLRRHSARGGGRARSSSARRRDAARSRGGSRRGATATSSGAAAISRRTKSKRRSSSASKNHAGYFERIPLPHLTWEKRRVHASASARATARRPAGGLFPRRGARTGVGRPRHPDLLRDAAAPGLPRQEGHSARQAGAFSAAQVRGSCENDGHHPAARR